ncbi:uncharacterized protein LOC119014561 [Acanthopagrus latus]|uniref:uncharacterized protein LOC119014561 n=1 Tax=Acanthopagrus latus TaxID=8177 RepID=UPI00187C8D0B|nr:uncharacterized protein LOC119014561 [Acanthopagrus latus]
MSAARRKLQEALCQYSTDTLANINTVSGFCKGISSWMNARENELRQLKEIKDKLDQILNPDTKSKRKALKTFLKGMVAADNSSEELETELAAVLADTLEGLKKLDRFLEAVEKLAVTSLHVFMEGNQVLHLPKGISLERVQVVIIAAQIICPLLLKFKRDASVFFLPKLHNVEVLLYQLDKYTETTQKICEILEKSISDPYWLKGNKPLINVDVDLSEDEIQGMLCHINQLNAIRMDQNFRLVFLFQDVPCSDFISNFKERNPRMLEFLTDLEEVAVQLDSMNKGAKISSVAGSSVGAIGGILSIVGLALIPVTAGVSVGLIAGGAALGVTSGVNSVVTTATEIGVNRTQQNKASEVFQSFMEDVQSLQECLEEVMDKKGPNLEERATNLVVGVGKVLGKVGRVGKGIDALVDAASALMKNEKVTVNTGKVVAQEGKALCNVPRAASDIPDVAQAAAKGPLALGKSARAGFIALNALFVGVDVFFICKDGYSLAKGSETEVSKFIRARAALWSSEIDSWKKIHDSLCKGQKTSEEHRAVLDKTFYPERAIKKN